MIPEQNKIVKKGTEEKMSRATATEKKDIISINRPDEPVYLNVDDIAKKLHINLNAAYQLCKRPGFPAVRVSARRIVIPADAFHDWMISNPGV